MSVAVKRRLRRPINGMVNMRDFIVNRRENIPRVIRKSPKQREKEADVSRVICWRRERNRGRGKPYRGKWVSEKRKPRDARG